MEYKYVNKITRFVDKNYCLKSLDSIILEPTKTKLKKYPKCMIQRIGKQDYKTLDTNSV